MLQDAFFNNQPDALTPLIREYLTLKEIAQYCLLSNADLSQEGTFALFNEDVEQFRIILATIVDHSIDQLGPAIAVSSVAGDSPPHALLRTIDRLETEKALLLRNRALTDEQRTALEACTGSFENILALNTLLDEINMDLARIRLPASKQHNCIDLDALGLTRIPETLIAALQEYPYLNVLNLENNKLIALPESFGVLTRLTELFLPHNQLTRLPESISNLTELKQLFLQHNALSTLPLSFGNLTALTWLNLFNNQFSTLPESFDRLTALSRLILSKNQFTTLPSFLGNLAKLAFFDLECNQLTTLPASFDNLTNLKSLMLHGNPLSTLPYPIRNTLIRTANYAYLGLLSPVEDPVDTLPPLVAPALVQALRPNKRKTPSAENNVENKADDNDQKRRKTAI